MTQRAFHLKSRSLDRLITVVPYACAFILSACVTPHTAAEFAATNSSPYTAQSVASRAIDWPSYGFNAEGTRFSPAAQITAANVHLLKLAWTYRSPQFTPLARGWGNCVLVLSLRKRHFRVVFLYMDG